MADTNWSEMASFLNRHQGAIIVAPPLNFFKEFKCIPYGTFLENGKFDFFIIHKPVFGWIDHGIMAGIINGSRLIWENNIFYVLRKKRFWHTKGLDTAQIKSRLSRCLNESLHKRKIVFVHVPKCAGRTLYHGLKKYYRRQIYLQRFSQDVNLQQNNFIAGHVSVYEYEQLLAGTDCLWLTVLRDPVKRIASLTAHARRGNNAPMIKKRMAMFQKNRIDKIIDSDAWFETATQSISMLSGLSPSDLSMKTIDDYFEGALAFIHRKDVLIGIQEDMPRYYEMIEVATGLSPDTALRKNTSSNYSNITDKEMAFLDSFRPPYLLKEIELYNTAKKLFYDRYEDLVHT